MLSTKAARRLGLAIFPLSALAACINPAQVWDRPIALSPLARAAEEAYLRALSPGYFAVSTDGQSFAYATVEHPDIAGPELVLCTNYGCRYDQRYGTNTLLAALAGCSDLIGGVGECRLLWETRRRLAP